MKQNKKRILALVAAAAMIFSLAAGCSNSGEQGGEEAAVLKVGVIQYATHASLDNCYTGLVQGLAEKGFVDGQNVKVDLQNANADVSAGDLMAKNMVTNQYDLLVGIATPAAQSAYAAARDSEIPVIFTAVSDPISAGIVQDMAAPGVNCTGSSDALDLEAQMQMIRAFLPEAKKIGIIYTTSEANSVTHLSQFEALAPQYGFEILSVGITNGSEVAAAAASLVASGVDCFNNFTDNMVVDNMSQILNAANEAGIPLFGSEEEQVRNGCLACQGIDYIALGQETGRMAAAILAGEANAAEMAVYVTSDYSPFYNSQVGAALGLELPAEYANATDVAAG